MRLSRMIENEIFLFSWAAQPRLPHPDVPQLLCHAVRRQQRHLGLGAGHSGQVRSAALLHDTQWGGGEEVKVDVSDCEMCNNFYANVECFNILCIYEEAVTRFDLGSKHTIGNKNEDVGFQQVNSGQVHGCWNKRTEIHSEVPAVMLCSWYHLAVNGTLYCLSAKILNCNQNLYKIILYIQINQGSVYDSRKPVFDMTN